MKRGNMIFGGADIGSSYIKLVLIDRTGRVLHSYSTKNLGRINESVDDALEEYRERSDRELAMTILATGYGRGSLKRAASTATEVTCLAKAALNVDKGTRTIIDIGGQDSKAISLDSSGRVSDFIFNDKCSAGTGRFLETLASILDIPVPLLGEEVLKAEKGAAISSVCTVFATSEVVSLLSRETPKGEIVRGVHEAFAFRVTDMVQRIGLREKVLFTGGVAKNEGLAAILEGQLKTKLLRSGDPQVLCAFGAALLALERGKEGAGI